MKKYLIVFALIAFTQPSLATDPNEIVHQCEQYGSYQNDEGEWLTCEYEEEPEVEDAEEDIDDYEEDNSL